MRTRTRQLTRLASIGLGAALIFGMTEAIGRAGAPERGAETPSSVALENGVTVTPRCNQNAAGVPSIALSGHATHKFLGYGANLQATEASMAAANAARTVSDLRKLGFVWVRMALGADDGHSSLSDEESVSGGDSTGSAPSRTGGLSDQRAQFYTALHAAGIKIVAWGIHNSDAYFNARQARNGNTVREIRADSIAALAQYAAEQLRAAAKRGLRPDLIELFNEPNLRQHKFTPEAYAELVKDVEAGLANPPFTGSLVGPGTTSVVRKGVEFVDAMQANGSLSSLKAITVHTYYVRDRPNNFGIPPANDPALQNLFQSASRLGVPLISTEFGGTDLKTKLSDPNRESVDAALEFKAALDLIEAGESAAIVWNLYPNHLGGRLLRTWALIDASGPTNAYWPFYILSRRIPVGAEVLGTESTDVNPTMTSPGYAAFREGRTVFVGLSNPAPAQTTVALDVSRLGPSTLVHAAGFLPNRAVETDASVRPGSCKLNVTIPSGTGTVLEFKMQSV